MALAVEDLVRSVGRIKTIQNNRRRFIEFGMGRVIAVDEAGVSVTPVGKNAVLLCRPEDLEVVEQGPTEPMPDFEPGGMIGRSVGDTIPVQLDPGTTVITGDIAVSGTVAEEPKPTPKAKPRTLKEKREAEGKPAPRQRRRR